MNVSAISSLPPVAGAALARATVASVWRCDRNDRLWPKADINVTVSTDDLRTVNTGKIQATGIVFMMLLPVI